MCTVCARCVHCMCTVCASACVQIMCAVCALYVRGVCKETTEWETVIGGCMCLSYFWQPIGLASIVLSCCLTSGMDGLDYNDIVQPHILQYDQGFGDFVNDFAPVMMQLEPPGQPHPYFPPPQGEEPAQVAQQPPVPVEPPQQQQQLPPAQIWPIRVMVDAPGPANRPNRRGKNTFLFKCFSV